MDRDLHYSMVMKAGCIPPEEAKKYISELGEHTLNQITSLSFDRRLIKPILERATEEAQESGDMGLDEAVNNILNNKKRMLSFMSRYCL